MTQNLDDKIPYGIVLHPTEEEFSDFRSYVYKVVKNPKHKEAGFIKVI